MSGSDAKAPTTETRGPDPRVRWEGPEFKAFPGPSEGTMCLGEDEIHLWAASLCLSAGVAEELLGVLSADERDRIRRLRVDRQRRRAAASRGLLRYLLASYTDTTPDHLRFEYGAKGKPALAGPTPNGSLHFSLAHSADLLLVGIARGHGIGVDIELMRPLSNVDRLAARCLSSTERALFRRVPSAQRSQAFLVCWTRKEAFAKAIGQGLALRPRRIEVTPPPELPARLLAVDGDRGKAAGWELFHLEPEPAHVGALAARKSERRIGAWNLDPEMLL